MDASVFLVFNLHGAGLGSMFVSFEYQVRGRPSAQGARYAQCDGILSSCPALPCRPAPECFFSLYLSFLLDDMPSQVRIQGQPWMQASYLAFLRVSPSHVSLLTWPLRQAGKSQSGPPPRIVFSLDDGLHMDVRRPAPMRFRTRTGRLCGFASREQGGSRKRSLGTRKGDCATRLQP